MARRVCMFCSFWYIREIACSVLRKTNQNHSLHSYGPRSYAQRMRLGMCSWLSSGCIFIVALTCYSRCRYYFLCAFAVFAPLITNWQIPNWLHTNMGRCILTKTMHHATNMNKNETYEHDEQMNIYGNTFHSMEVHGPANVWKQLKKLPLPRAPPPQNLTVWEPLWGILFLNCFPPKH